MGGHTAKSWVRCVRSLQGVVLTAVALLVLNGAMADAADTCPEHFTCRWEGDVFLLHCEPMQDVRMLRNIAELSVNTTRLKIVCDRPTELMGNLYDIRVTELFSNWSASASLKTLSLVSHTNNVFILGDMQLLVPRLELVSLTGVLDGSASPLLSLISHEYLKSLYVTSAKQHLPVESWCLISVSTIGSMNHTALRTPTLDVTVGSQLESISFNGAALFPGLGPSKLETGLQMNDYSYALKYIDVSNFQSSSCINIAFVGFHALDYCNIQNVRSVDPDVFKEMSKVTVLLLGNNDLKYVVANDTENLLFRENKHLKFLDLAVCQLTEIPTKEFAHLQHLQQLNLSSNSLEEFHVELHTLKEFRFLNLSDNKLKTVSAAMRVQLDQMASDRNVQVDISRNPLECTCNDTEFVSWIQKSRVIFQNKQHTFCTDRKQHKFQLLFRTDTDAMERDCNPGRITENHKVNIWITILISTIIVFV